MRYAGCTAECIPARAIGAVLRPKRSDPVWPDEPLGRLSPGVATALRFAVGGLLGLGPVLLAETGILVAAIPGITGLTFALLAVAVSPGLFCGNLLLIVPLLVIRSTRSAGSPPGGRVRGQLWPRLALGDARILQRVVWLAPCLRLG